MARINPIPWSPTPWVADSWAPLPPSDMQWARFGSTEPGQGVHGFVDDWRLESLSRGSYGGLGHGRLWATEPDFSVYLGMPEPVQRYQVYRSRYLGDRFRALGLQVVPSLAWTGIDPIEWTAWGVRPGSVVAVRAPGSDSAEIARWFCGFAASVDLIRPSHVLVFGAASRVSHVLDPLGLPWSSVPLRRHASRLASREAQPAALAVQNAVRDLEVSL